MSLKKKIILSFSISALIIAILAGFEYVNFIKIRKEIRYLEITDTIRGKSLELRRHEKNFLLRTDTAEIQIVYSYLDDLREVLSDNRYYNDAGKLASLKENIEEYERIFRRIVTIFHDFRSEFSQMKPSRRQYAMFFPLIESTFLERPLVNAELLEEVFLMSVYHPATINLRELNTAINSLRESGENIIITAKELDRTARQKVDSFINISQLAILVFFPLFVIVGIGTFLFVISNVVKRLQFLTDMVEKTGMGYTSGLNRVSQVWSSNDEVDVLMHKFSNMEQQLAQREKELVQSKKLAAIGTFASGVAHELNNPLNNIYTTAQRLMKKMGNGCPSSVKKGLDDIFGQTMRVKRIVGDLLEFARGREPQFREVELIGLLNGVFKRLGDSLDTRHIEFGLNSDVETFRINVDPEQTEQVFVNLFTNALETMSEGGSLIVNVASVNDCIEVRVADTGRGIPQETIEKIFEPFYTTKDKGTGLGLAIVFNIIQKHHGEIKVESEVGKGTVFIIKLPKREQEHGI